MFQQTGLKIRETRKDTPKPSRDFATLPISNHAKNGLQADRKNEENGYCIVSYRQLTKEKPKRTNIAVFLPVLRIDQRLFTD